MTSSKAHGPRPAHRIPAAQGTRTDDGSSYGCANHLKFVLAALAVIGVVALTALVGAWLTGDDRAAGSAASAAGCSASLTSA